MVISRPLSADRKMAANGLLDPDISDDEDDRYKFPRPALVTRSIASEARAIVSGAGFGCTARQLRMCDFGCPLPRHGQLLPGDNGMRQQVLLETLRAFEEASPTARFHVLAQQNRLRWKAAARCARSQASPKEASAAEVPCQVVVLPGDWGVVTLQMTRKYGATFACLNMANAYGPGGGYTDGMVAQEENMFRRTDCHFALEPGDMNERRCAYVPEHTDLLNATDGRVYLDVERPRVCIRGAEDRTRSDLGYAWLDQDQVRGGKGGWGCCRWGKELERQGLGMDHHAPTASLRACPAKKKPSEPTLLFYRVLFPGAQVFPFYELRAAAVDLRNGSAFDSRETARRIGAQLDTLIDQGGLHHPSNTHPPPSPPSARLLRGHAAAPAQLARAAPALQPTGWQWWLCCCCFVFVLGMGSEPWHSWPRRKGTLARRAQ